MSRFKQYMSIIQESKDTLKKTLDDKKIKDLRQQKTDDFNRRFENEPENRGSLSNAQQYVKGYQNDIYRHFIKNIKKNNDENAVDQFLSDFANLVEKLKIADKNHGLGNERVGKPHNEPESSNERPKAEIDGILTKMKITFLRDLQISNMFKVCFDAAVAILKHKTLKEKISDTAEKALKKIKQIFQIN